MCINNNYIIHTSTYVRTNVGFTCVGVPASFMHAVIWYCKEKVAYTYVVHPLVLYMFTTQLLRPGLCQVCLCKAWMLTGRRLTMHLCLYLKSFSVNKRMVRTVPIYVKHLPTVHSIVVLYCVVTAWAGCEWCLFGTLIPCRHGSSCVFCESLE